ncbi:MAG: hypothetical protein RL139_1272 [Gemmatimonadota bacterium]|jgi:integrase
MHTSRPFGVRHDYAVAKRRARRGDGTVYYSRTDRRWVARFPLGIVKGQRQAKRVKCLTERAARAELEQLRRTYGSGIAPTSGTLDAYLDAWLAQHRNIADSTKRSYADHVRLHISPLLGGIPVARLRASDVDRLIDDRLGATSRRGRPLSPNTVRRIVTTLHIALQSAVDRGELPVNVAGMVQLPPPAKHLVPAMSGDQANRILEVVSGHWLEPLVALLLGSALRLGEALSLYQGDVHPDDGYVTLRESKTSLRSVRVSPDAADAILEALRAAPRRGPLEPLFFGPRTGKQLTGATVSHALPKLMERAGLPRLTPHALRHGHATLLVAKGVHMRVIAEQLGHRNPALTAKVYAHVLPESQREALELLPRRARAR